MSAAVSGAASVVEKDSFAARVLGGHRNIACLHLWFQLLGFLFYSPIEMPHVTCACVQVCIFVSLTVLCVRCASAAKFVPVR